MSFELQEYLWEEDFDSKAELEKTRTKFKGKPIIDASYLELLAWREILKKLDRIIEILEMRGED